MNEKHATLSLRLQRLGFTTGNQMRLYGQIFEFLGEPIVMTDSVVLLDATEKKSGETKRVRVPLTIINMASGERRAA